MMRSVKQLVVWSVVVLLASCNAYEKVAYVQQAGRPVVFSETDDASVPEARLKVGDVLMITVNTTTPEAAIPFNLPLIPAGETGRRYSGGNDTYLSYGLSMQNYLIDMEGYIEYPVIGKIKATGMTKSELARTIKQAVYPQYIKEEPIVLVRFVNFKVSVLGEVAHPGSFPIDNEKVSIFEALALAGDMTIYGNRESVLLMRENNGNRESVRLDLRNKDLIDSPYFYLQQNDVLYVEPNKSRARASGISSAESLSISVVGTLISLSSLIINILR